MGQDGAGGRLATGVADLGGPVSDDENHLVSQFLKLVQLTKTYDVSQVDIRSAGIESHLEAQRLSSLQHPDKLIVGDDFLNPTASYFLYYIFAKQR